jgi:rRNA biogenesis protein RRP5
MTSKFAVLEFKVGSPDRGRTLLDGILDRYPRRVDIWSIYLDQEIKLRDFDRTRQLFERSIHQSLSSKKIKFFFKRYLQFEKEHGTPEGVEHVKQAARAYVESKSEQ